MGDVWMPNFQPQPYNYKDTVKPWASSRDREPTSPTTYGIKQELAPLPSLSVEQLTANGEREAINPLVAEITRRTRLIAEARHEALKAGPTHNFGLLR